METSPKPKRRKWPFIVLAVVVVLAVAVPLIVLAVSKAFTAQESVVRSDWQIDAGEEIGRNEAQGIEYAEADLGDGGMRALYLVPDDIEEDGFTFYDTAVQDRLAATLEDLKTANAWTADNPLAVVSPYGTSSNGLYLYFTTDVATEVQYTVHVDDPDIPDFTATAADASGQRYGRTHEFQLIGLVPGEINEVTLTIVGSWGNVRQTVHFTADMPETESGYATKLSYTDGDSDAAQTGGLFTMMRVNGYLGYGFMYDNAGVLRYEMVLEGYGLDRVLTSGNDIITCVSSTKLARLNGLGRVVQVYDLDGYELHHDIGFGRDGEILALAEHADGETVEDQVLSIDIESGEVTSLLDFTKILPDYFSMTRPVSATDPFFWQAGEWDWMHLNSLQYMPDDDSLIVSSRETSTIIKVKNIHSEPEADWFAGDERVWADTPYAGLCLTQEGDFVPQYGQHCVEFYKDGDETGVYYLLLYNNNYWATSSRDDFSLEMDDSVGTDTYGDGSERSYVYIYKIDENNRTFALDSSFEVPYSSIVSNGTPVPYSTAGNWVVNSGVSMVFGEYDASGALIREYEYDCTMQNYRTFKYDYMGFWFQ